MVLKCWKSDGIWPKFSTLIAFLLCCLLYMTYVSCSVMSDSFQSRGLYIACQAPLSMEFFRQKCWKIPSPGNLPAPCFEPRSPALQADSLPSEPPRKLCLLYTFNFFTRIIHVYDLRNQPAIDIIL